MARKKRNVGAAVAIGSGVGAVAGAAIGAAAMAMADKSVRESTLKSARKMGTTATKTLAAAGKTVQEYGGDSVYGTAGGRASRGTRSTKKRTGGRAKKKE